MNDTPPGPPRGEAQPSTPKGKEPTTKSRRAGLKEGIKL